MFRHVCVYVCEEKFLLHQLTAQKIVGGKVKSVKRICSTVLHLACFLSFVVHCLQNCPLVTNTIRILVSTLA